ncbi:MAG: matrixin family metalloprotease [Polyangiaceae bacterium]|nr:matrixin family metalloprotease [Polyangiaceae bacterium]
MTMRPRIKLIPSWLRLISKITLQLVFFFALILRAQPALAYCQATSCSSDPECRRNRETGCTTSGIPLSWRRGCIGFAVGGQGSPKTGISSDVLATVTQDAIEIWGGVSCGDESISLSLKYSGPVSCEQAGYQPAAGNANIISFVDEGWAYTSNQDDGASSSDNLGHTELTYDLATGELVDTDIELNSEDAVFSTEPNETEYDLLTVVLHEMGHALGLDHSQVSGSVMQARSGPGELRHQLHPDDRAGVCALYGGFREEGSCVPDGGLANDCAGQEILLPGDVSGKTEVAGCSFGLGPVRHNGAVLVSLLFLLCLAVWNRFCLGKEQDSFDVEK